MRRPSEPNLILGAVCASLLAITANLSILNIGLPTLAQQLRATNAGLQWIVDSYSLTFAGFLLAAGSLGDRIGRKRVITVGLALFGVCSGGAALTHSTSELIVARAGMGIGAALVMPITLSILTEVYPTEAGYRRAMGIWAATASAGAVVAPPLAGLLLSAFWWGSLFLINVPLAVVTIIAIQLWVPESAPRRHSTIDWPGIALSVVFSLSSVFALIEGPELGWSSPRVIGGFVVAVAAIGAFWILELRANEPLVDVRYFRNRNFSAGCAVVGLQYFIAIGIGFVVTQYMQLVLGLSPLRAGLAVMPSAAVVMVVAPLGARAFGHFGARSTLTVALVAATIGIFSMRLAGVEGGVVTIILCMVLLNLSTALISPGTTSMVMGAVTPDRAGMASGAQSATRQLGGALGVAVLGSILAARYGSGIASAASGTAAARYVPIARRSLADALHAASPGSASQVLLAHLARSVYTDAMHLTTAFTAGVTVLAAIGIFVGLRATRPGFSPSSATSRRTDPLPLAGAVGGITPSDEALLEIDPPAVSD